MINPEQAKIELAEMIAQRDKLRPGLSLLRKKYLADIKLRVDPTEDLKEYYKYKDIYAELSLNIHKLQMKLYEYRGPNKKSRVYEMTGKQLKDLSEHETWLYVKESRKKLSERRKKERAELGIGVLSQFLFNKSFGKMTPEERRLHDRLLHMDKAQLEQYLKIIGKL